MFIVIWYIIIRKGDREMLTLNEKQKRWLFENDYVTAKVLDACIEQGWREYYINYFDWKLDLELDMFGFNRLWLVDKDEPKSRPLGTGLNFQDDDFQKLLALK